LEGLEEIYEREDSLDTRLDRAGGHEFEDFSHMLLVGLWVGSSPISPQAADGGDLLD
jgi:hypothetical protein